MTYEDLFEAVRRWAQANHPGRMVRRLVVSYMEGEPDTLSVPSAPLRVEPAAKEAKQPVGAEDEDEETDLETAIRIVLIDAGECMTASQVVEAIKRRHGERPGESDKSIVRTLTRLHKEGKLILRSKSQADGLGKGYGIPEWEINEKD